MTTLANRKVATAAELLALPDAASFELVDGELVERPVSVLSSLVEVNVCGILFVHCRTVGAGLVWGSSLGYRCYPDAPDKVRRPDTSFVRKERFRPEYLEAGFLTVAPDLAVEVLSPNDTAYEVAQKIEEYLGAGVPLVWVIDPETRIVMIHRQDGTVTKLHGDAELTGEDILPGFRCSVASLFPPVPAQVGAKA